MVKLSYYSNLGIEDFSRLGLIWNLFADFGKMEKSSIINQSRSGAVDRFDFTDKLIERASSGGIDLNQEDFNIGGYDFYNRKYSQLNKFKKLEKEVYLVNEIDKGSSETTVDGYGEYSENRLVSEEDEYAQIDISMDYQLAWGRFVEYSKKLEGIGYSLVYLLLSFIDGSKSATENLNKLCSEDEDFCTWLDSIFIPDKLTDIVSRLEEFKEIGAFV